MCYAGNIVNTMYTVLCCHWKQFSAGLLAVANLLHCAAQ